MYKGIFITGTDTDVGKTVVTAGLLNQIRAHGVDAVPMKPVQTGCVLQNGVYHAPDLDFSISYSELTHTDEEYQYMSPYKYDPACSPHLAGKLAGECPVIDNIVFNLKKLEESREFILVEGAGGIMVPLSDKDMMIDLMKTVGYPVILVARTGLGTINHTLLSLQALRNAGLNVLGIIFNNITLPSESSLFIREDNVKTIVEFGKVKVLGIIEYLGKMQGNFDIMKESFNKNIDYKIINNVLC